MTTTSKAELLQTIDALGVSDGWRSLAWSPVEPRLFVGGVNRLWLLDAPSTGAATPRAVPFDREGQMIEIAPGLDRDILHLLCRTGPVEGSFCCLDLTGRVLWEQTSWQKIGAAADGRAPVLFLKPTGDYFEAYSVASGRPLGVSLARDGSATSSDQPAVFVDQAWSPTGALFAALDYDGVVSFYDRAAFDLVGRRATAVRDGRIEWVADDLVAVGGCEGGLSVIEAAPPWDARALSAEGELVALQWLAEARLLMTCAHNGGVEFRRLEAASDVVAAIPSKEGFRDAAVSADETMLAAIDQSGTLQIWNVAAVTGGVARDGSERASAADAYIARQALTVGRVARRGAAQRAMWTPEGLLEDPEPARNLLGVCRGPADQSLKSHDYPSVALSPDGRRAVFVTHSDGDALRFWEAGGALGERIDMRAYVNDVDWSPDGALIAVAGDNNLAELRRVEDAAIASQRNLDADPALDDSYGVRFSPDGRVAALSSDAGVFIYDRDRDAWASLDTADAEGWFRAVAWSHDGQRLAAASNDGCVLHWTRDDWTRPGVVLGGGGNQEFYSVCFSPDGVQLCASGDEFVVERWDWRDGASLEPIQIDDAPLAEDVSRSDGVCGLVWSSDGALLALADDGGAVYVWSERDRRVVFTETVTPPSGFDGYNGWRLRWSPDDAFLVAAHKDPLLSFWDMRPLIAAAKPVMVAEPAAADAPTQEDRELAQGLATLAGIGVTPAASLLEGLLAILGSERPRDQGLARLAEEEGVVRLAGLRWPRPARVGLTALLLAKAGLGDDWRPPTTLPLAALRDRLRHALAGPATARRAPPTPVAALSAAAREIDPSTIALLASIGAEAVAARPDLALRAASVAQLPAAATLDQAKLNQRLPRADAGRSASLGGSGAPAGLARRGAPRNLAQGELALADRAPGLFDARGRRGELLYRAHAAVEPPRLRPAALILDASAAMGREQSRRLRAAAHIVAASLIDADTRVAMIVADAAAEPVDLAQPADLLALWEAETRGLADETAALASAARALPRLGADSPTPPIAIVFSHAHFAADVRLSAPDWLRAALAPFPGMAAAQSPLAPRAVWLDDDAALADRLARLFAA